MKLLLGALEFSRSFHPGTILIFPPAFENSFRFLSRIIALLSLVNCYRVPRARSKHVRGFGKSMKIVKKNRRILFSRMRTNNGSKNNSNCAPVRKIETSVFRTLLYRFFYRLFTLLLHHFRDSFITFSRRCCLLF